MLQTRFKGVPLQMLLSDHYLTRPHGKNLQEYALRDYK